MASPELEAALLQAVDAGELSDSAQFAAAHNVDHQVVVGLLKSLLAADMIVTEVSWSAGAQCCSPRISIWPCAIWRAAREPLPAACATHVACLAPPPAAARRAATRVASPHCPLRADPQMQQDIDHFQLTLTAEAQGYLGVGSPEAQVFAAVPPEGATLADIKVRALSLVCLYVYKSTCTCCCVSAVAQRW